MSDAKPISIKALLARHEVVLLLVILLDLPVISPANAEEERAKVKRDAQRTDLMRVMSNSPVD